MVGYEQKNIYDLDRDLLVELLKQNGFQKFNANQVFSWLYQKRELDTSKWSNVSNKLKSFLIENFDFSLPQIIWNGQSSDGTRKFLIKFNDSKTVETVLIPAKNRMTICISSQVGCAIGCTFCHTGTMGLTRHLMPSEVVGQFLVLSDWLAELDIPEKITNIVYMGQGEPLHNFDHIKTATSIFLDEFGLGLGQRRITLSTSGMVPQIKKLNDFPPVNIAISLHAAHDDIRSELMPINKVYDLNRLLTAIKEIPLKAHRWITFEYLLIKGLNDRAEDIEALVDLLPANISKVNLIPFNEYPESSFKRPSDEHIKWFNGELNRRGIITTTRVTKGTDILAACGQLKSEYEKLNLWNSSAENRTEP